MSKADEMYELFGDFSAFSLGLFPHKLRQTPSQVHYKMYESLQDFHRYLAFIIPRGHAKSTIGSVLYPLYRIGNHRFMYGDEPDLIAIISESQRQSQNFLNSIKNEIEYNKRFRYYYGDLKGRIWSKTEIETKNGVRIIALGTGQKIRGAMYNNMRIRCGILDDFESESNSMNEDMRRNNKDWILGAVMPSLASKEEEGRLIAIGTIIHEDTFLYERIKDPNWKTIYAQAILPNGEPLWPERFSKEELEQIRNMYAEQGKLYIFYREYMNVPTNLEARPFQVEKLKKHQGFAVDEKTGISYVVVEREGEKVKVPVDVYIGVDPAISTSVKADYTVILALGIDYYGNRYVLRYTRDKLMPDAIIEEIIDYILFYKPIRVTVEAVAYQEMLYHSLRRRMEKRGVFVTVHPFKPHQKKEMRLMGLQPIISAGKLHIDENMGALIDEMKAFPAGKHDDLLDGLYYANLDIRSARHKEIPKSEAYDPVREALEYLRNDNKYDWRLL